MSMGELNIKENTSLSFKSNELTTRECHSSLFMRITQLIQCHRTYPLYFTSLIFCLFLKQQGITCSSQDERMLALMNQNQNHTELSYGIGSMLHFTPYKGQTLGSLTVARLDNTNLKEISCSPWTSPAYTEQPRREVILKAAGSIYF